VDISKKEQTRVISVRRVSVVVGMGTVERHLIIVLLAFVKALLENVMAHLGQEALLLTAHAEMFKRAQIRATSVSRGSVAVSMEIVALLPITVSL
jgi:hypothetical protein